MLYEVQEMKSKMKYFPYQAVIILLNITQYWQNIRQEALL